METVSLCFCVHVHVNINNIFLYVHVHVYGISCVYYTNHSSDLIEPACIQTDVVVSKNLNSLYRKAKKKL